MREGEEPLTYQTEHMILYTQYGNYLTIKKPQMFTAMAKLRRCLIRQKGTQPPKSPLCWRFLSNKFLTV